MLVRLCSIEANFSKPLSSEANQSFGDDLRGWNAIAPNLFIWNYVTNFANYLIPHPNMRPLADALSLDREGFELLRHETAVADLYDDDALERVYYPEIDNTLAMKIGGEANPDLVSGKELEAFARDAGLAPAGVKRRVSELADPLRLQTEKIDKPDETAEKLAALISKRCERHIARSSKK